ncbi:UDP-glycosyltransferase 71K1-like [Pistacia vera]|nr:UDP-glycosyltransferase 71K1-like [Pistacia vera]
MKKAELVFIPVAAAGHLIPQIEFAKRLLDRDDRFSVTVLVMQSPSFTSLAAAYAKSLAESNTPIRFINLPPPIHFRPSQEVHKSLEKFATEFADYHKASVKEAIVNHVVSNSNSAPLAGLVIDMFCTSMIDVGNELGVPSYLFFTCNAAYLSLSLYLPSRQDEVGREFEVFDSELVIPGYVNPVPSSGLPEVLLNKNGGYTTAVNHGRRFKETKGIIINSFEELESHAVKCLLNDFDHLPPVYTVGPLIDLKGESNKTDSNEILKWLDNQPDLSVVFLCFGSMGSFGEEQLKEIALGLEQSEHRFLWSIREPPPKNELEGPSDYKLDELLPAGLLERTKEIGMVCKWAPQKEILAHKSVGGFVSHCGWNSSLESLWFGVPIVTWPMYAEQQMNAFQMVKDLGVAVELRLDYRSMSGEVVLGDEIARAIKCVMEIDNEVRKKVREKSEQSRLAVKEGGSSFTAFQRLIDDICINLETN